MAISEDESVRMRMVQKVEFFLDRRIRRDDNNFLATYGRLEFLPLTPGESV